MNVLPCELSGVCAAQSVYGFLQQSADHLRMIVLIRDTSM